MGEMAKEALGYWQVSEGEYSGAPIIVRLNTGLQKMIGDKKYPFRVGIAVPLRDPQKNGLPNMGENDTLTQVEDAIVDYFDTGRNGYLCIVITTQGMREFVSYAKTDTIDDLLQLLRLDFPMHTFQHYVQKDKKWDGYLKWISEESE